MNAAMRGWTLLILAGALALLAAACRGDTSGTTTAPAGGEFRAFVAETPVQVADFTLSDQFGEPFRLSDQRGKVVLLFFGYTYCPDICPNTLVTLSDVYRELEDAGDRVAYVFVSVDPERDTPERLREFLALFDLPIVGLTGDEEALASVWASYGVFVEKEELAGSDPADYGISHTSAIYAIDPHGRLRLMFPYNFPPEDIVHDVRILLEEGQE